VAAEERDLLARLPREPADWGVVRHLYEFGRVLENPQHPDRALALRLIAAFLAELPLLDEARLHALLGEQASTENPSSDALREAIGRIAAPYDGGLLLDD
jgi:hypothetical protein